MWVVYKITNQQTARAYIGIRKIVLNPYRGGRVKILNIHSGEAEPPPQYLPRILIQEIKALPTIFTYQIIQSFDTYSQANKFKYQQLTPEFFQTTPYNTDMVKQGLIYGPKVGIHNLKKGNYPGCWKRVRELNSKRLKTAPRDPHGKLIKINTTFKTIPVKS